MPVNSRDGITLHTRAAEAQLRDVIRENVQPYTIHVDRQASPYSLESGTMMIILTCKMGQHFGSGVGGYCESKLKLTVELL